MIKLRKILLLKWPYLIIFIFSLIYVILFTLKNYTSLYQKGENEIEGEVYSLEFTSNKLSLGLDVLAKEKIKATYYFKSEKELAKAKENLSLGDTLLLKGELQSPKTSHNFYSFSYQEYLKYQNIFYVMTVSSYEIVKPNTNYLLTLKDSLRKMINNDKVGNYINVFFLGNSANFEEKLLDDFRKLGISHLFALSGTQVSFIVLLFTNLLSFFKITDFKKFIYTTFCLVFYYLIIDTCAAIDRAIIFNLVFTLNKTFNFNIRPFQLILLSLSILFFINPYYIFDIGFQYSTIISCTLILYTNLKNSKGIVGLLRVSWVSFLASLPISLYHFSYINILSVIYNLFYVPFINFIIFPLAIICFLFPFLSFILSFFIAIFETSVNFLANIKIGVLILPRLALGFYFLYYGILGCYFYFKRKLLLIIFVLFFLAHYCYPLFNDDDRLYMLDVGQGDSFLLLSRGKSILIDTGGVMNYYQSEQNNNGKYLVTLFHQLGLKKIDYLILSHGDYDHAGDALNIEKEMRIDNIFFNGNELNSLEKEIWKKTEAFKVKLMEGDTFMVGNYHFQVLSYNFSDENEGSLILYVTIDDKSILFMGDATIKSEEYLLANYDLDRVTFLKVGHHGSRTSSSLEFLEVIRPTYSLISAGIDNKFSHPHLEVVNRLEEVGSKIYDVRETGMVEFNFSKNRIKTNN